MTDTTSTLGRRTLMKLFGALAAYSSGVLKSKAADAVDEIPLSQNIPNKESIFRTIEQICSWGIRRPGSPADIKTEKHVADAFKSFGLTNVRMEPVEFQKWEPTEYSLLIKTEDQRFEVECFSLPHTALDVDLEVELALFEESDPGAVKGKASLHSRTSRRRCQLLADRNWKNETSHPSCR